jgi:hypothetical protein
MMEETFKVETASGPAFQLPIVDVVPPAPVGAKKRRKRVKGCRMCLTSGMENIVAEAELCPGRAIKEVCMYF